MSLKYSSSSASFADILFSGSTCKTFLNKLFKALGALSCLISVSIYSLSSVSITIYWFDIPSNSFFPAKSKYAKHPKLNKSHFSVYLLSVKTSGAKYPLDPAWRFLISSQKLSSGNIDILKSHKNKLIWLLFLRIKIFSGFMSLWINPAACRAAMFSKILSNICFSSLSLISVSSLSKKFSRSPYLAISRTNIIQSLV